MEKFNEADLMKEIKSCTYEQDYVTAVKLAEKLDLNKMKNVSSLCLLGEVFLHEGENDLAEKVLLKAYEKMPKGRRALDLLTSLYIEKGSYSEAEYYYKEFISVASRDLHRYILRYRLDKGKGERTSVLIHTLEQLKDYEYIEEWAYELAKLYHEAGEDKKCIRECDEIVLWFGHGEYVDLANELKAEVSGKSNAGAVSESMQQTVGATYMFDSEGLLERSGLNVPLNVDEYMKDDEYSDVYDLEEGGHTEAMAVSPKTKTVADILAEAMAEKTEAVVSGEAVSEAAVVPEAVVPEAAAPEEAVVLEEAAVSGLEEKTGDMGATMVLDSSIIAAKAAAILAGQDEDEEEDEIIPEDGGISEEQDFITRIQKKVVSSRPAGHPAAHEDFSSRMRMVTPEDVAGDGEEDEIIENELDKTAYDLFFGDKLTEAAAAEPEEISAAKEPANETPAASAAPAAESEEMSVAAAEKPERVVQAADAVAEAAAAETAALSSNASMEDEDEIVTEDIPVPDTVLDIFSTAVDIKNVKKQLAETFTKLESSLLEKEDILAPYDINFVVSGRDESMKSQISIGIAKALNTYGMCDKGKIVRATSDELNSMDFSPVFEKISGGCLIISGAGMLNGKSVSIISDYVNQDGQKVAIVLEDSESDLHGLWKKYPKLRSKFLNVINISKYDVSELIKLAESYAKRRGYDISDEVRVVTLRDIFEARMVSGKDVNYEDVMAVIDEAVVNLEKRNMKNLFMTVLDNSYKEASMFTLLPEDFD